ncbi:MAG: protein-glutamine gamma-glutamyltransferase [Oscillospiraceae bacterium]|jgi:protein-glutamine gamma-glutamyltransferase|nr:protein-glutamine gamma-glutamyltransferase [Oscillospiraceae bacterium]
MITINGQSANLDALLRGTNSAGVETETLSRLSRSFTQYDYDSMEELRFELVLRREIVAAANALLRGGLQFETFRNSYCNPAYWSRTQDGGFVVNRNARASDAIADMFKNGRAYGTECATAMQIVYYGALLKVLGRDAFDREFAGAYLMNWHRIERALRETGLMRPTSDPLPGDRRYFMNPDVNTETPEWQGENVIDMGDGSYYGHGIGRRRDADIIADLNKNRRLGSHTSAYLMPSAGRPNFKRLAQLAN